MLGVLRILKVYVLKNVFRIYRGLLVLLHQFLDVLLDDFQASVILTKRMIQTRLPSNHLQGFDRIF